jgi:hypothetical protein
VTGTFPMTIIVPHPQPPAGMTLLEAMARGYLPADVQITNLGAGLPNPTIALALSTGRITHATLCSTLAFAAPYASYGGT